MTYLEMPGATCSAADAYNTLADFYDVLTTGYCHDVWLERIEELALAHGQPGRRVLDIACGTGKSFLPLAERGYEITACDISERMVEIAREKCPDAEIGVADMRELPDLGQFDLITCLDDAVNYLLTRDELDGFFDGVARNLTAAGIAVFDANSIKLYREDFAHDWLIDDPDAFIVWTARDARHAVAGDRVAATVHLFAPQGSQWLRTQSRHEQRHWPRAEIAEAARMASLRIAEVHGQHRGAVLDDYFDELVHNKALYLAIHEERG